MYDFHELLCKAKPTLDALTLEQAKEWQQANNRAYLLSQILEAKDLPAIASLMGRIEDKFAVLLRIDVENQIADKLIDDALFYGCLVSVNDGEEWTLKASQDKAAIRAAMASTDADLIRFRDADRKTIGDVLLIWGNGWDLISDCTDNEATKALLKGAEDLAESLQG